MRCKNIASLFSPLGNIIVGRAQQDDSFLITASEVSGFFQHHVEILHPCLGRVMIYAYNLEVIQ